jgi:hypothetical protein
MYLLVDGWNLKSMASQACQGDESIEKDEGTVKSTPLLINQEVAPPLVSSTNTILIQIFNRQNSKILSLALLVFVFMNPINNLY